MENEDKLPRDDLFDVHSHPTINECPKEHSSDVRRAAGYSRYISGRYFIIIRPCVLASFQRDNVFAMCRCVYILYIIYIYIHRVCFVASYGKI